MDINQFKSKLQFGGARSNLFRVIMSFPVLAEQGGETEELSFLCKAAQIPGSTVGLIEVPFLGRQFKVAGDRTFEDWTITVLNDNDFLIRNAFERWMNLINSHESNVGFVEPQNYMTNATVEQLNRKHEVVKVYRFVDMFPQVIEPIELSMDSADEIEEWTATMSYQYWTSDTTT